MLGGVDNSAYLCSRNTISDTMIRQETISRVIDSQQRYFGGVAGEVPREQLRRVRHVPGFATIVTGLRRVGKSTLLGQVARAADYRNLLYLNFDDINLNSFAPDDFTRLHHEIERRGSHELFFDEIQMAPGWEVFVHQLLREGYAVFATGSNASMLSVNLGTHLTGRHLSFELLPFSYAEYLVCRKAQRGEETFQEYLTDGGIPEYAKTGEAAIVRQLVDDVLIRDIAVNRGIRNVNVLRQLAVYLLTNIARPYSANTLREVAGVASTATVIEYISAMRDAYLIDSVPLFSDSLKAAARNAKKVYAYDTGMAHLISLSRVPDTGRLLENYVYVELRRKYPSRNIFYYQRQGECDFIATNTANVPEQAIQVCHQLTDDNFEREVTGLRHAMEALGLKQGLIITSSQQDRYTVEEGVIDVLPAYRWETAHA